MKTFHFIKIIIQVSLFLCLVTASMHASKELEECFINDWGTDIHTSNYLVKKFESINQPALIADFIAKSKGYKIDFTTPRDVSVLPAEDAVLLAPKHHLVIFENLYVRILWGSTQPKEKEPFHLHTWKSLMVILKPTTYEITYPDGKIEIWNGEIGVYELPANEQYGVTNSGAFPDELIRFEIKE